MPLDIVFFGIQMPTLLPFFFFVAILQIWLDRVLLHAGVYEHVWHPGLFRTAVFVSLFTLPCLIIYR
jgi:protein AaeX